MLSGKFVLRIDPKMHKSLKEEAQRRGESLNSLCLKRLAQRESSSHSSLVATLVSQFNPLGIILFGSAARGEARASSDIDLLIVLDNTTPISRDLYKKWDAVVSGNSKYSPQFVHFSLANSDIGSLWLESSLEGEILFDRDSSVKTEIHRIRSKIAEGHYQRKVSYGHAYWIKRSLNAK